MACDNYRELPKDGLESNLVMLELETHHCHSYGKKREYAMLKPHPTHPNIHTCTVYGQALARDAMLIVILQG